MLAGGVVAGGSKTTCEPSNFGPHKKMTLIGDGAMAEMCRMVEFHTDSTQTTGSSCIILRNPGKPETARLSSPNAQSEANAQRMP